MRIKKRLKAAANKIAKRFGYRIERVVDYGEDEFDIFELIVNLSEPSRDGFFFLQVGANDGVSRDPINCFVKKYHWRGVLLEPQPTVFEKLLVNYSTEPQLIFENAAIAAQDGQLSLWTVRNSNGALATFDKVGLMSRVKDPAQVIEIPVKAVSFKTLIAQHSIRHVDLMVVDTEGFDYEVLKMAFDAGLPAPKVILYEHLHLSTSDRSKCHHLLADKGYSLRRDGTDTIAVRKL